MSATTTYALDLRPPASADAKQVHQKLLPAWVRLVRELDPAHSEPVHLRGPQDVHRLLHPRTSQELCEVFYVITLNTQACVVGLHEVTRAGTLIDLTPTEFALLRYLMLNAGRVLSKAQILDHVWNYDFAGEANVVETYISYLRKKIDRVDPHLIHTIRGVGYSLRLPRA